MNTVQIKAALGLPENLAAVKIRNRALRLHCAGGGELLDVKEWLGGIMQRSRSDISRNVAESALTRLAVVEAAMCRAIERARGLPPGALDQWR